MRVTSLEQVETGHWVIGVERDITVRRGIFGRGEVTAKRIEHYASLDGFAWVDTVSGARAPSETEVMLERLFDHEMEQRPTAPAVGM
jgi:hypothetical protein